MVMNDVELVEGLVVSVLFLGLHAALAAVARILVNVYVRPASVQELFYEAIAAAELCASCFELIIIADNYGVSSYAIFLFLLTIWWSSQWGDATACPYTHIEDVIEGRTDIRRAFLKIWAEIMGGCCVYRYVQILWSLELAQTHVDRAFESCTADLQVPALYGALIEGIATCLCRIASRALVDSGFEPANVADSFIGTSLVVAAFNYSGGYFNPVLATGLKYGCRGNNFYEHVGVYWIGAIAGSAASTYIYKLTFVQNLFKSKIE